MTASWQILRVGLRQQSHECIKPLLIHELHHGHCSFPKQDRPTTTKPLSRSAQVL
jgi:hypothetical protein